ncbi:MAG: DUF4131 domain-containing protein, partial [Lachnospiraceae bacterium]|nr:DUF4131 domain-containing protein [Lachnospiraceae bacterium]
MHRPLVYLLVLLAAGILSGQSRLVPVIAAIILIALVISSFTYFKNDFKETVLLLILAFTGFAVYMAGESSGRKISDYSQTEYFVKDCGLFYYDISACVCDVNYKNGTFVVTADILEISADIKEKGVSTKQSITPNKEKINILLDSLPEDIKCGSILEFNSRIDFYDTAMNEGGFDAKYYYRTRKVTAKAEPGKIE